MNKLKQLKDAIHNPPPERLAKIEYQSHFLQIIGISFVCIFLILKGFWYIVFAFIFGIGVSYSQGMTAYRKYITIMHFVEPEKIEDYDKDISPTRRRSKIVGSVFANASWLTSIISVILAAVTIGVNYSRWILILVYPITIFLYYIIIYYYVFYWICYPLYKKKIKMKEV